MSILTGINPFYDKVVVNEWNEIEEDAIYIDEEDGGKKKSVKLNKPFLTPGGPKKRAVYVKNEKGNTIKVTFGDPNMRIKSSDPERKSSFRARHNCDNPGPKTKARYWSCRMWAGPDSVKNMLKK